MSPAPPKNRKPPPARELGPEMNSFNKRQRGGMQRPRSAGLSTENPLGLAHALSRSQVGAGGEGAGVFPLLAEGRHLARAG